MIGKPKHETSGEMLGESESFLEARNRLSKAAKVNRPVLILGERGTGKELAAARLHYLSPRWQGPYITLNCAALSPGLLDAELFGHEAGAFTGAGRKRHGRFAAASGGTLFLDEISHLTLEAQAKILRVVEYHSFQLVGSSEEIAVDTRVIAATNADIRRMCQEGTFLPDLWDRLSFEVITLPPLRDRPEDISLLAHNFAARMTRELGRTEIPVFSPEAMDILMNRTWPGNVRELKNVVERAVYHSEASLICEEFLEPETADIKPSETYKPQSDNLPDLPLEPGQFDKLINQAGLKLIDEALIKAGHNQRRAAELLSLSYHRFRFLRHKFSEHEQP